VILSFAARKMSQSDEVDMFTVLQLRCVQILVCKRDLFSHELVVKKRFSGWFYHIKHYAEVIMMVFEL
jgi:hypothetical protein